MNFFLVLCLFTTILMVNSMIHPSLFRIGYHKSSSSSSLPDVGYYDNVTNTFSSNYTYFFIYRHRMRLIPNVDTLNTLIHHIPNTVPEHIHLEHHFIRISSINEGLLDKPLPTIAIKGDNPDEYMRAELQLSSIFYEENLLRESFNNKSNIMLIGRYINPSVVFFKKKLFLAEGAAWNIYQHDGLIGSDEQLHFKWVFHPKYSNIYNINAEGFNDTELLMSPALNNKYNYSFLGVTNSVAKTTLHTLGQDPRMLYLPKTNQILVVYTNRFIPKVRMGFAIIGINEAKSAYRAPFEGELEVLDKGQEIVYHSPHDEKNWSPFLFNNSEVYLIQSIDPLHILRLDMVKRMAEEVSLSNPIKKLPWTHGHLRGGTNAVFLPRFNKYLAFFHSAQVLQGCRSCLKTYTMGAYTFTNTMNSAGRPNFKLLEISPMPIMPEKFYTGAWSPFKNRRIDYVVFPTSLILLEAELPTDEEMLLLTMGFQDQEGYLVTLKLSSLLDTLVPVHYQDL